MRIQDTSEPYGEWGIKLKPKSGRENSDYRKLKSKLLVRFGLTAGISFAILYLLYTIFWQGRLANRVVSGMQMIFGMDYDRAMEMYQQLFRNNAEGLFFATVLIVFFILLQVVLNWFTGYFDMINHGIGLLLEGDGPIHLPPEMKETEQKLNSVKTELERRAQETQIAEQRKNDLVMYLAHDIRTPLTSIIGYLNLLFDENSLIEDFGNRKKYYTQNSDKEGFTDHRKHAAKAFDREIYEDRDSYSVQDNDKDGVGDRDRYAAIALDKAYRLEKMINEFFDLTRYNSKSHNLHKENIDLYYMLVQLTDELLPMIQENANTVSLHAKEDIIVYGDPDKLARVFNNILKNAVSYGNPNTEIRIDAVEVAEGVIISFTNQGRRLSEEALSVIFDKFSRLDEARQSSAGGTGLGLAIAKEIISLHGGKIEAFSTDTTFTIRIELPGLKK